MKKQVSLERAIADALRNPGRKPKPMFRAKCGDGRPLGPTAMVIVSILCPPLGLLALWGGYWSRP